MNISAQTQSIIDCIENNANKRLQHRVEIAQLLELAAGQDAISTLDELSFHAKFVHKSFGIMQRIGKDADGYEKLESEFTNSLATIRRLTKTLLTQAPVDVARNFDSVFLSLTPDAFRNLLLLIHDLSRYKDYRIDTRVP